MNFLQTYENNFREHADKTAIEFIEAPLQTISYTELDTLTRQAVTYLGSLGVRAGDRVGLQLPKCLEFIVLHLAALRMGAITLPLNPAYPLDELQYFLSDSESLVFFADAAVQAGLSSLHETLPALKHFIYLDPTTPADFLTELARHTPAPLANPPATDSPAVMVYTSGTTGRPKGAVSTYGNLTANMAGLYTAWGWQSEDVLLHVLPIFHVHGLFVALHGALFAGATALLMRKFDAQKTLENLVARQATILMAVPTIHRRLLDVPGAAEFDLSHMRLLTSGSDRLPDESFTGFQETFGHTLLERYGMTETGMNLSNPLNGERRIGSVGLPLPGVEARVVDPESEAELPDGQIGAVQVRGPHVFKEYWRMPEKTAESFTPDGWLRTGDLGLREPDGYFSLQGRAKDLIITGGYNVYPPEVERVLAEHSAVAANAVIGCPDPEWGERIGAVVVLAPGQTVSADELIDYCRKKLAAYKAPRNIYFVEELPRNSMGKVQKVKLRGEVCK